MRDIETVAVLQDPVRRALYEYVAARGADVGRAEAAEAAGVQRTLAAFHLDRLVDAGLLEAVFRRVSGRTGPGAGRPAKLYRRAAAEFEVTLPARDYRAAAQVLAEVAERLRLDGEVAVAARARGEELRGPGDLVEELAARGYEPYAAEDGTVRLRNCPFHALAAEFPPLVCGMNLALLEGLAAGSPYTARMDARPGECCVAVSAAGVSKNNED